MSVPIKWAQRRDRVFITIDIQNCKDPAVTVTNDEAAKAGRVSFLGHAVSHGTGARPERGCSSKAGQRRSGPAGLITGVVARAAAAAARLIPSAPALQCPLHCLQGLMSMPTSSI